MRPSKLLLLELLLRSLLQDSVWELLQYGRVADLLQGLHPVFKEVPLSAASVPKRRGHFAHDPLQAVELVHPWHRGPEQVVKAL